MGEIEGSSRQIEMSRCRMWCVVWQSDVSFDTLLSALSAATSAPRTSSPTDTFKDSDQKVGRGAVLKTRTSAQYTVLRHSPHPHPATVHPRVPTHIPSYPCSPNSSQACCYHWPPAVLRVAAPYHTLLARSPSTIDLTRVAETSRVNGCHPSRHLRGKTKKVQPPLRRCTGRTWCTPAPHTTKPRSYIKAPSSSVRNGLYEHWTRA